MTPTAAQVYERRWWILAVLCLSLLIVFVGNSIEKWFNGQVEQSLEGSLEVAHAYYQDLAGTALGFARHIAERVGKENLLGARSGTALGDGWVRSACIICLNRCGILAHVTDDGSVDKIMGDPANPHNHGRTCAKGDSGMEGLRDPNRITTPLRRTSPKKGPGVNPRWKPISWEEALSEIADRMKAIREEDPKGLLFSTFDAFQLRGPFIGAWIKVVRLAVATRIALAARPTSLRADIRVSQGGAG